MSATEPSGLTRVGVEFRGPVGIVTLRDTEVRNAISEAMRDEVILACEMLERAGDVGCVVFVGSGGTFSSGADLREFGRAASMPVARAVRRARNVYRTVLTLRIPTLAIIEGAAVGGGLELAMCCDVRIAVQGATVGLPEVRRGFIPGGGGTQLLGRRAGVRNTDLLLLGGSSVPADEARRLGIVHEVLADAEAAHAHALQLAAAMAGIDRPVAARLKQVLLACA